MASVHGAQLFCHHILQEHTCHLQIRIRELACSIHVDNVGRPLEAPYGGLYFVSYPYASGSSRRRVTGASELRLVSHQFRYMCGAGSQ